MEEIKKEFPPIKIGEINLVTLRQIEKQAAELKHTMLIICQTILAQESAQGEYDLNLELGILIPKEVIPPKEK